MLISHIQPCFEFLVLYLHGIAMSAYLKEEVSLLLARCVSEADAGSYEAVCDDDYDDHDVVKG